MNIYICTRATLLVWILLPMAAQSMEVDEAGSLKGATKVRYLEPEFRDGLPRVLQRIELSSDIMVYRFQVAANDQVVAQLGRLERAKVALAAETGSIAVLYPDLEEPFRSIFRQIIEGIEAQVGAPVVSHAVGGVNSPQDIVHGEFVLGAFRGNPTGSR